jgi:hypothetical protein
MEELLSSLFPLRTERKKKREASMALHGPPW